MTIESELVKIVEKYIKERGTAPTYINVSYNFIHEVEKLTSTDVRFIDDRCTLEIRWRGFKIKPCKRNSYIEAMPRRRNKFWYKKYHPLHSDKEFAVRFAQEYLCQFIDTPKP